MSGSNLPKALSHCTKLPEAGRGQRAPRGLHSKLCALACDSPRGTILSLPQRAFCWLSPVFSEAHLVRTRHRSSPSGEVEAVGYHLSLTQVCAEGGHNELLCCCESWCFTPSPINHGFRVLPSAIPPHDQPSGNYRGQEHRAVGWPPAKDPRVRTAGFLLGFMPCHAQRGLGGSWCSRTSRTKTKGHTRSKNSATEGLYCGYFPRKTNKCSDRSSFENK